MEKTQNENEKTQNAKEQPYEILGETYKEYNLSFKIIVIGDSGVGKSCLSLKGTRGVFEESFIATVGFEFFAFHIRTHGEVVKLQIWDTCGQEVYRALISNFFRNSSLAIIVYAINDRKTFDNISVWIKQLRTHSSPDCKVFLIGNKADLEDQRQVTFEEGKKLQERNNFDLFMETSAKTGLNAQHLFVSAAMLLYGDYLNYQMKENEMRKSSELPGSKKGVTLNEVHEENLDDNEGCC